MEIRRFSSESDNIDEISRVYAQSWKTAYRTFIPQAYLDSIEENRWSEYLTGVLPNLWLACENGRITGVCTYAPARDSAYVGWGEIVSLYLLPQACGKGIGKKLLLASMESLNAMGLHNIYLWAFEDNLTARRFYEKNGFASNGEKMLEAIGGRELYSVRYVYQPAENDVQKNRLAFY